MNQMIGQGELRKNYANRDDEGRFSFYVLLWKRNGISSSLFYDYWRDVHGRICARLPGQFQYWQYHLMHNEGGYFPVMEGIDYTTLPEDQFDGIAELTFRSDADRKSWFEAASILMDDEPNFFRKCIGYITNEGNVKTAFDSIRDGAPNSEQELIKFHVLIKKSDRESDSSFRHYLNQVFAPNILQSEQVAKFRLSLFEKPDTSRAEVTGTSHFESDEKLYQAAFEIAFNNAFDRNRFFASQAYAQATKDLAKYVKQLAPFPQRSAHTFVYDGKMTLAGKWGARTAQLITTIGANNILKSDIEDLVIHDKEFSFR